MEMGKNTIFLSPKFYKFFCHKWGKKLDQGGKYYIVSPQAHIQEAVLSSDIVTKKDCVQREKYDLIFLLQYFPPSTQSVRVEKLLHGLKGKK